MRSAFSFSSQLVFSLLILFPSFVTAIDSNKPPIVVAGATGRAGLDIYNLLKKNSNNVRVLVRSQEKAKQVLDCGECTEAEGIFIGDVTRKETLTPAMEGAGSLVIATGAVPICKHDEETSSLVVTPMPNCTYPDNGWPIDVDWNGNRNLIESFATNSKYGKNGRIVLISARGTTVPYNFLDKLGPDGFISFYKLNLEAFLGGAGLANYVVLKPCGLGTGAAYKAELNVGHDDDNQKEQAVRQIGAK